MWDLQERPQISADPELATQLWTGRRLQNGRARELTPLEYQQLRERWKQQQQSNWPAAGAGPPAANFDWGLLGACLAACAGFVWLRRSAARP